MLGSYTEVRDWLESFIPLVYGKSELGLSRIENLLKKLGDPQKKFKSIHVAGTSGKGTTAFYIARLLMQVSRDQRPETRVSKNSGNRQLAAGNLKVGLHVSPHLVYIGERMQINGKSIPVKRLVSLVNEIKPVVDEIKSKQPHLTPSYFEILVAISFLYFAKEKVDYAVVEVGIGGRLDATNVLMPQVSVITNIGLDHTEILGNTFSKIAKEKAGIIKQRPVTRDQRPVGIPVVTAAAGKALKVIEKVAKSKNAPLITLDTRTFNFSSKSDIRIDRSIYNDILRYSQNKAVLDCMFLAVLAVLVSKTKINPQAIGSVFLQKFPGRFEEISNWVILDGAHNPDKIKALVGFLENQKFEFRNSKKLTKSKIQMQKYITLVIAFKTGKDWKKMLDLLIKNLPIKTIIATEYQAVTDTGKGSAVKAGGIAEYIKNKGSNIKIKVIKNSQEAVFEVVSRQQTSNSKQRKTESRKQPAVSSELTLVTGSLYLIGEARTLWKLPEF